MGDVGLYLNRIRGGGGLKYFRLSVLAVLLVLGLQAGTAAASGVTSSTTFHISNTTNGGDCTLIGIWDASTTTCTLDTDVTVNGVNGIQIDSDGVTVDGAGHTLTGNDVLTTDGVYLLGRNGDTVKNLTVNKFGTGVELNNSNGNTVSDNDLANNDVNGIFLSYGSGSNTISDNNCTGEGYYGIFLKGKFSTIDPNNNNVVSGNTASGYYGGLFEYYNSNNTFSGNTCTSTGSSSSGIILAYANNDIFSGNTSSGNPGDGIKLGGSSGNTISGNTFSSNSRNGINLISSSKDNQIYHNNFISNATQAAVDSSSTGNLFNLSAPTGGNYWSNWTSPDSDNDGFVDNPYIFTVGQDNLPLTTAAGCGKPDLALGAPSPFWASYADYTAGLLSVTYSVNNSGGTDAANVQITGSSATNGVTLASAVPASVGSIAADASAPVTLVYNIPSGVASFVTTNSASAEDNCGTVFTYGPALP